MRTPIYDPSALRDNPAFRQLSPALREHLCRQTSWPAVQEYDRFVELIDGGMAIQPPRFASHTPGQVKAAGGYEQFIAHHRVVPTRPGNWHDLFNALVWLHYPRFKWAANALQLAERNAPDIDPRNGRSPVQSRAAQFDEGGVVLWVDDEALLEPLQRLDWRAFFVAQRPLFGERIHCLIVGHALYETLLHPFIGITAKALPVVSSDAGSARGAAGERQLLDAQIAESLEGALRSDRFLPLPLLGVPGWHSEQSDEFYANPRYFRPGPSDAAVGASRPEPG